MPLARIAFDYRWSWDPDGPSSFAPSTRSPGSSTGATPSASSRTCRRTRSRPPRRDAATRDRIARLAQALDDDRARPDRPVDGLDGPVVFVCAEFGIHSSLPIYSGGLGALAGDILKQASDLALPVVGVGLLYRKGYFQQRVDRSGLPARVLDADRPGAPAHRPGAGRRTGRRSASRSRSPAERSRSTSGGSRSGACRCTCSTRSSTRTTPSTAGSRPGSTRATRSPGSASTACSESARVRALRALGIEPGVLHFNEGHPRSRPSSSPRTTWPLERHSTTRSPRACAVRLHDPHPGARRERGLRAAVAARRVRGPAPSASGSTTDRFLDLCRTRPGTDEWPGMTPLALRLARRTNGVSRLHGEVAREMWRPLFDDVPADDVPIDSRDERCSPAELPRAADARAARPAPRRRLARPRLRLRRPGSQSPDIPNVSSGPRGAMRAAARRIRADEERAGPAAAR